MTVWGFFCFCLFGFFGFIFAKWVIVKGTKKSAKEKKELDFFNSWTWLAAIYLDVQKTL